jgi:hypothetical protein
VGIASLNNFSFTFPKILNFTAARFWKQFFNLEWLPFFLFEQTRMMQTFHFVQFAFCALNSVSLNLQGKGLKKDLPDVSRTITVTFEIQFLMFSCNIFGL